MSMKILLIALIAAVLVIGCTQPGGQATATPTPAATATIQATATPAPTGEEDKPSESDLASMTVSQLQNILGGGERITCVATTKYTDPETNVETTMTYTSYLSAGKQAAKITGQNTEGAIDLRTYIDFDSNTITTFMGGSSAGEMQNEDCNWLKMTIKSDTNLRESALSDTKNMQADTGSYSGVGGDYKVSCSYGGFDESVFTQPTDKVCDLSDLAKGLSDAGNYGE